MIEQLFQAARAPFITVRDGRLHLNGAAHEQLTVQIHDVRPVRKLFVDRRLECYSLDCRTGKAGRFCELCPERRPCSRRLQLRLVCRDAEEPTPAILEIPKYSFAAFDRLLEEVGGIEKLADVLVTVAAVRTESGWTNLDFQLLF
jgi:hypothetical protein